MEKQCIDDESLIKMSIYFILVFDWNIHDCHCAVRKENIEN